MHNSDFLASFAPEILNPNLSLLEQEMLKEITGQQFDREIYPQPVEFYDTVIDPEKKFIDFWGKDLLHNQSMIAMLNGSAHNLKQFFSESLCRADAWEYMFKQEEFQEPIEKFLSNSGPKPS